LKLLFRIAKEGLLIVMPLLILAGCGYRFTEGNESKFAHLRTFFVEGFVNKTGEAYSETIVRAAFTGRFVQEGRFTLAKSREEADIICRGTIRSVQISTLSYMSSKLASEERMTLGMEIIIEERASGKAIWEDRLASVSGDYLVADMTQTERNRKTALLKLAADSAERAYLMMMSDF
jgi:hypothetical protein